MNLVDVIALVVAAAAAFRGWRLGLLGQVFELGGGFLGLLGGVALGPRIASAVTDRPGLEGALISIVVVFVGASLGQTLGYIVGHRFGAVAHAYRLGGVNSGLGAGLGVVVVLVSFWLLGSILVHVSWVPAAKTLRRSEILQALNSTLPRPPNVLAYISQYLNTSGFPRVFAGLPRAVGPPVELPSQATALRAIRGARASTVRIVVPACGGTQVGTGWVGATSTVVTNAHVVAGGDDVTVQEPTGRELDGEVVLFDPRTDVAIVHVPAGLSGPVLDLRSDTVERGAPGATLGYPGFAGGELVPHAAAVQDTYRAVGLDIYGRSNVSRNIYELRSPVRQGDSGGPFVLPNGDVAGVVFAASTTNGRIGYALTGAEVQDELARGATRTEPVSTGPCTH